MPPKKRNREDEELDAEQQRNIDGEATAGSAIIKTEDASSSSSSSGDLAQVKEMLKASLVRNARLEKEKSELVKKSVSDRALLFLEFNFSFIKGFETECKSCWTIRKNPYAYSALSVDNAEYLSSLQPSDMHIRVAGVPRYTELLKLMRAPSNLHGLDLKPLRELKFSRLKTRQEFVVFVLVSEKANFTCVFACYLRRNVYFDLALSHRFDNVSKKWKKDPVWEKDALVHWWCKPERDQEEISSVSGLFVSIEVSIDHGQGLVPLDHRSVFKSNVESGLNFFWEDKATFVRLYLEPYLSFVLHGDQYSVDPDTFLCVKIEPESSIVVSQHELCVTMLDIFSGSDSDEE